MKPFVEDRARVDPAVAVGVFEDDDAVLAGRLPVAVVERLGDEQSAAIVEAERDRLHDVRLGGDERDGEAVGNQHRSGRLLGGPRRRRRFGGECHRRQRENPERDQ